MERDSRRVPDAYIAGCSHVAGLVSTERTGFADQSSIQNSLPYSWDGPFFRSLENILLRPRLGDPLTIILPPGWGLNFQL